MDSEETLRIVKKNQCGGCGKYFSGMTTFDRHRVGSFQENNRRCMTTEEMEADGMAWEYCLVNVIVENKRSREKQPVWYDVAGREELRRAFHRDEQTEETEE